MKKRPTFEDAKGGFFIPAHMLRDCPKGITPFNVAEVASRIDPAHRSAIGYAYGQLLLKVVRGDRK